MAYVYRHIRTDINKPFYIGVGNDDDLLFKRAYDKAKGRRAIEWYEIAKSTEYEVEILISDIPLQAAYEKEKEFIKLYGRIDIGTGCLINKTDGGKGCINGITKETRRKMADKLRGKRMPEWQREILSNAAKGKRVPWSFKPVVQYDQEGNKIKEYESITAACKELNLYISNVIRVIRGERRHAGGFKFKYK